MNEHTAIGGTILGNSSCDLMQLASDIARTHHERWDGKGYPKGLAGEEIPLVGRIAAVADVFDALTTVRPYKEAWSFDRAFAYLREQAGSQFDPGCVAAFLSVREELEATRDLFPEEDRFNRAA
jgi:putative two-component system response regulator